MDAAVVIPTFNRKDALRAALQSSFAQTVPIEAIVVDDGSTDGTEEMMRREFPHVLYERHSGPNGPAFLRNRGSELASAPILFPIDDDAMFASSGTVEQTLAEFQHPRVAAVGIPFINVRTDSIVQQRAPDDGRLHVTNAFVGAAHAVRRDRFLAVGGYRPAMFYMGEESDLCVRFLDHGWIVRLGRADPMHHFESPQRVTRRADLYGRQNDILYPWYNVPWPYFPFHLAGTTALGVIFGFRVGRPGIMLKGLMQGYRGIFSQFGQRKPVRRSTYRLSRLLKRHPLPLEQIADLLPPLQDGPV